MSKEELKTTLLTLFKAVAELIYAKSGKVIECKRPGWGYLLEFDEKTGEVLSQLHHLDLCNDEEYIKDMYYSLITELKEQYKTLSFIHYRTEATCPNF